jgi:signal peptidase II
MRRQAPFLALILGIIALDQIVKAWVAATIPLYSVKTVIPGFFDLTHIRNSGAIFGLMSRSGNRGVTLAIAGLSLAALGMVGYYFIRTPASQRFAKWSLALILGGALGNQVDRLFRGSVVDFAELHVGRFHWPTFNLADSCITIGAVSLIAVLVLRRPHASHPD